MEAWRVWPRRQKIVIPKYHKGKFFPKRNHLMKEGLVVEK
jgi:hypothetical protein